MRTLTALFLLLILHLVTFSIYSTNARSFPKRSKLRCANKLRRICNYLGSYCHADVISGRKKRSTDSFNAESRTFSRRSASHRMRRRRGKRTRLDASKKCNICHHVCWR